MEFTEIAIIGGGPAGLCAAIAAADAGARVTLFERDSKLGGQLLKQTHKFFGSEKQYAGQRGFEIADILEKAIQHPLITVKKNAMILAVYEDGVITYSIDGNYKKISSEKIIVCTGALEKISLFENNDLPGIYGAGAIQTMMNLYGIPLGKKALMVGAGNIGLIIAYQMMQAGIEVAAIIDVAPEIGGYLVHASNIRRYGVPIYTSTTLERAIGVDKVEKAVICKIDSNRNPIENTRQELDVDIICLAVGLKPFQDLLVNLNCERKYVPGLGGYVPLRNKYMKTTNPHVYVAGDVAGIEEATSAMLEGTISGYSSALDMGFVNEQIALKRDDALRELQSLRSGEKGEKVKQLIQQITI